MLILAHTGELTGFHDLWTAWNIALFPLLALAGWIYVRGVQRIWSRAGYKLMPRWRVFAFLGGLGAITVALASPLDALSSVLFSAHMMQHVLLVDVSAPLLVAGSAFFGLLNGLPRRTARPVARLTSRIHPLWHYLTHPVAALLIFVIVLWMWHAPPLYELALSNTLVHDLEHLTLLGAGMLFWSIVFSRSHKSSLAQARAVPYLFLAMLQGGGLGALLVFSRYPWYRTYIDTAANWGLSPLIDQQIAGTVMWLPGGLLYTTIALYLIYTAILIDAPQTNIQTEAR